MKHKCSTFDRDVWAFCSVWVPLRWELATIRRIYGRENVIERK